MLVFSRLLTSISISWLVNCASVHVFVIDWIIAEMIDSWDDILPVTSKENVRYVVQKKHVDPSRFPWPPPKKHIDASSVVCTLINDDKLANQIARLVAIVVKSAIAQIHNQNWCLTAFLRYNNQMEMTSSQWLHSYSVAGAAFCISCSSSHLTTQFCYVDPCV